MSIALESGAGIGGSGLIRGLGCGPIYGSADIQSDPPRSPLLPAASSSSLSSSVGKDSDASGRDSDEDDDGATGEVKSAYRGVLLGMGSLEESLPIRRGISRFYSGKSKSFADLSGAASSCASAKDLSKAENAYTRSRRNLLASRIFSDRPHKNPRRSPGGGVAKRPGAPARSTLGLAVAMSSRDGDAAKSTVGAAHLRCSFPTRSFSSGDLPVLRSPASRRERRDE